MARIHARLLLAVAAVMAASGCYSSNYIPQSRGRVSVVMVENKIQYVRDGRMYPHGLFGAGLVSAVAGSPAAERAARSFYQRQRDGFLITIGGFLCSGLALGFAVATTEPGDSDVPTTELLIAGGCLIGAYAGLFYMVSATPYRFDAINIFNDYPAVESCPPGPGPLRRPQCPAYPPGHGSADKADTHLSMR